MSLPSFAASGFVTLLLGAAVSPCSALANTGSFLRYSSGFAGRSAGGAPPLDGLGGDDPDPRVLFVLYSDSKFYHTRLRWVMDTWGSKVPNGTLVAIGDKAAPDDLGLPVRETQCATHSHEEGACCKYGEAVIEAGRRMQLDPSLAWAYFIDDDVYARPQAITQLLTGKHEPLSPTGSSVNASNGIVRGTFSCGSEAVCEHGLCGGGGYAADRRAVAAMLSGGADVFLRKQMENCKQCNRWADLAVSQFIEDKNITKGDLPGAYGWRLPKIEFDATLERGSPEPLMYHYIQSEQQMSFLHSLFEPGHGKDERGLQVAEENAGSQVLSRVVARVVARVVGRLLGHPAVGPGCASFRGETTCRHGVFSPAQMPWLPTSVPRTATPGPNTSAPADRHRSLAELLVSLAPTDTPTEP